MNTTTNSTRLSPQPRNISKILFALGKLAFLQIISVGSGASFK